MKASPILFAKILIFVLTSQLYMSCYSYQPLVKNQKSKSINGIIKNVSLDRLYLVRLKTGIIIKIQIRKVDDESIYGTLYQKNIYGVENSYENDKILISNIDSIQVRDITISKTIIAIAIPVSMISIIRGMGGAAGSSSGYSRVENLVIF